MQILAFPAITIISSILLVIALLLIHTTSEKTFMRFIIGLLIGLLGISLYVAGFLIISPMIAHDEIKDVYICDKFTSGGVYNIATGDGNTYRVDYGVYGFIPKTGNATLGFHNDEYLDIVTVTKIFSNTTCQAGCA